MPFDPATHPLTALEARVLATLMEKARTVPDSYPLTLNAVVTGCNQKTAREPVMQVSDAQAQEALDSLRQRSLVFESSGGRATRYEHNFQRVVGVPDQAAALLGLLMLRGPPTAGELRINTERWHRFADISSVCAEISWEVPARLLTASDRFPARAPNAVCCSTDWLIAITPMISLCSFLSGYATTT